jgi:DNA invertase Pin-like site-specific DNA recombinase
VGKEDLKVFRLSRDDFIRVIKLYPMDEDILFENIAHFSLEDDKKETASRMSGAPPSTVSLTSLASSITFGDEQMRDKTREGLIKAKKKRREQGVRAFCNAAVQGNTDVIQRLIKSGININGTDVNGRWVGGPNRRQPV